MEATKHVALRPAGVRYLFAGRSFEGRPSYHVLGLLLLAQLGLSGALWAARSLGQAEGGAPLLRPLGAWAGGGRAQPAKPRHAVLLEVRPQRRARIGGVLGSMRADCAARTRLG